MDLNNQLDSDMSTFDLNDKAKSHLLEASKWATFLSITGMVGLGAGLAVILFTWSKFSMAGQSMGMLFGYLAVALFYLIPLLSLLQFSTKTRKGLNNSDSSSLAVGLQNLKSLFKFMGVMTIIVLVFYVLMFLFLMSKTM